MVTDRLKSALECPKNDNNFSQCALDPAVCSECWLDQENELIKCACIDFIIENMIKDPQKSLPLDTSNSKLRKRGNKIITI